MATEINLDPYWEEWYKNHYGIKRIRIDFKHLLEDRDIKYFNRTGNTEVFKEDILDDIHRLMEI